jgi:hypothetical protein
MVCNSRLPFPDNRGIAGDKASTALWAPLRSFALALCVKVDLAIKGELAKVGPLEGTSRSTPYPDSGGGLVDGPHDKLERTLSGSR